MDATPTPSIRPGRRGDFDRAARLLYESAQPMSAAAFGLGDPRRALAALERMYRARGNLFSWDACTVAEIDGQVVGIAASCRVDELRRRNLATIAPLARGLGPARILRLLLRGLLPTGLGPRSVVPRAWRRRREPPMVDLHGRGDFFVNALAVDPDFRRRGVARSLIASVHEAAAGSLTVNVFEQNSAARALYGQLGYRTVRRFEPDSPEFVGTSGAILTLQANLPARPPA